MFKLIYNVLHKKDKTLKFEKEKISLYLFCRWLTMASIKNVKIINETINKLSYKIQDNEMLYKILLEIIPKIKYKKIQYIKKEKTKQENKEDQEFINNLSFNLEMSKQEICNMLKFSKELKKFI
jgi:hypothetical protein